jgi:hypothetical protein
MREVAYGAMRQDRALAGPGRAIYNRIGGMSET